MRVAHGYPSSVMANVLGLLGILVYVVCVIGLAAGMTGLVVKLSPAGGRKPDAPQQR